jgi:hypothetical protein
VLGETKGFGDGGRRTHGAGAGRDHGASEKEEDFGSRPVIRVFRGGWPSVPPSDRELGPSFHRVTGRSRLSLFRTRVRSPNY